MKKYNIYIILYTIIIIISCSNDKKAIKVAHDFFTCIDNKDYKSAYQYISSSDKSYYTDVDSFYLAYYNHDKNIIRITEPEVIDTYVECKENDTLLIRRIQKIPEYELILKLKDKNEETIEFINNFHLKGAIPTKLDSSRFVHVIKEAGKFVVSMSLDKYSKAMEVYDSMKNKFFSQIKISPKYLIIENRSSLYDILKLNLDIINESDYRIEQINYIIKINGKTYGEEEKDYLYIVKKVDPHSDSINVIHENILVGDNFNELFNDAYSYQKKRKIFINKDRLQLLIKDVFFESYDYHDIWKQAQKQTGYKSFNVFTPGLDKRFLDNE